MPETASELIWNAFGARAPEGKTGSQYRFEPAMGHCAICGAAITEGVPFAPRRGVVGIDNPTFSGYAEYARWGSHVCRACAWLCGDPKRTHRAMLVVGDRGWWPTIAQAIDGRPRWRNILGEIARAAPEMPMTGVLTTDPKPRLWPRAQLATCGRPGMYFHCPEQDISGWRQFDLRTVAQALAAVNAAITIGATKSAALRGIWTMPTLADRHGTKIVDRVERRLAEYRGSTEFMIAAVVA
jgi:hypothetical protein